MVILNEDYQNGRITIQTSYEKTRINGLKTADWTENWSLCTTENDQNYDPTFFDTFCANFYWCFRDYNLECEPRSALGITEA